MPLSFIHRRFIQRIITGAGGCKTLPYTIGFCFHTDGRNNGVLCLTVKADKSPLIEILHFIPRKIYFAGTPSFRMTVVFFLAFRMTPLCHSEQSIQYKCHSEQSEPGSPRNKFRGVIIGVPENACVLGVGALRGISHRRTWGVFFNTKNGLV